MGLPGRGGEEGPAGTPTASVAAFLGAGSWGTAALAKGLLAVPGVAPSGPLAEKYSLCAFISLL